MKCAVITARTRTEADFELLTKLLDALGFGARALEEYKNFRLQPFLPSELILEVVYNKNRRAYPDLELMISDPDSAAEIIKKMNLEIVEDHSGNSGRDFDVYLPGGTSIRFKGFLITETQPLHTSNFESSLSATNKTFAIVVARFNSFITERLTAGAVDGLRRCGAKFPDGYEIVRVPGAFEIPSAARMLAETKKYDAILCIGCLLRGDTAHYDVIVNEVTRGIGQSAQDTGVPHAFGVLTCETLEQAIDRAGLKMGNKGFEAALAAVEMANLKGALSSQLSAVSKRTLSKKNRVSVLSRKRKPRS